MKNEVNRALVAKKKLTILFAALTLSAGLWAENPSVPPTGPIIYGELLFQADGNETVILVEKKSPDPLYSGNIVVPEWFNFTDTKGEYTLKVTKIGANAFKDCPNLTSVSLPASIEFIGDNAFANCEQLTSVICKGTEPATLGTEVFTNSPQVTIYVPIWTTDIYEEKWSGCEGIIKLTDFDQKKEDALDLIQTARQGIQNTEINKMIDGAFNDILRGGPDATPGIEEILEQIMTIITSVQIGKEEGQAEALGSMDEPCTNCTAVEVTDGTTTVTLYNATNVGYIRK